jgi:hypothetical protein
MMTQCSAISLMKSYLSAAMRIAENASPTRPMATADSHDRMF